jgi:hypothetical protein
MFFNIYSCQADNQPRALKKAAKHVARISDLNEDLNKFRQDKSNQDELSLQTSKKMMDEVNVLKEINKDISDTAKIKIPLTDFINKWTDSKMIYQSITSENRQEFMADATSLQWDLPSKKEGWKTLFPIFRP